MKKINNSGGNQKRIREMEEQIRQMKQQLANLRREFPPQKVRDYSFKDSFGNSLKLSSLFGDKSSLILIHNMGVKCAYCTLWADGFNGLVKHLEQRASFVVESADDPLVQRKFAADRGWGFRMVSSKGTSFKKDMGYEEENKSPWPGVSVFTRNKKGEIFRVSDAGFGPGDNFCALWDLLDLLPQSYREEGIDYFYSEVR